MGVRTVLTARVAHALSALRGTEELRTVDADDLLFQAVSYHGDQC